MDVSIINPFLTTAMDMFNTMFGLTSTYGSPFLVSPLGNHRWEVSGVIGIVGETEGILVLRVTKVFALKLLDKSDISIQNESERPQVMREMISELANIISGNTIAKLADKDISVTPPISVQGANHTISWTSSNPIIGVPFLTEIGPFEMQINLSPKKG